MYRGKFIRMSVCAIIMVSLWCGSSVANTVDSCPGGELHEFASIILVPNSEESEGQVENVCILCGYTYIEYLPATGHTYKEWQLVEEQKESGTKIERRECPQCQRGEVRVVKSAPEPEAKFESEPEQSAPSWRANEMDYVLSTSIGGLWGYAVLILWYNGLVLSWYKRECRKNMQKGGKE